MNLAAAASILAIALAADPAPHAVDRPAEPRSFAEFRPSMHGFAFVNSFEGSPVAIRGIELPAPGPSSYGLCGGMSAGAADFFLARRPVPGRTQVPRRPDALFAYLTRRNLDSLGDGLTQGVRFGRWMGYPDDTASGTMALSLGELTSIVARLDRGIGSPVGLVLVGRAAGARRRGA
ncbi:MAG: hypothetical protein K2Q20_10245, partial [Phycisphaerales bacterium]|nr:hypothetical protein [Phycisphaerales bacterium]